MTELLAQFNVERAASGRAPIESGIGIASGEVVAGDCGTPRRAACVCIGAPMQRAARLAVLATQPGRSVLIDSVTQAALSGSMSADTVLATAVPDSPPDGPPDSPAYALQAG